MKILFATYPMAFHTPGGGEIQLLAYKTALEQKGITVDLMDQWNPNFMSYDVVHFFSCMGGSIHFCNFIKQLGLPLVVSSSLWMTPETRHLYPADEIRAQLALTDMVITNSEMENEALANVLDLPREKFAAVYNGVEDIFFDDKPSASLFRDAHNISGNFVLNVANIEPRKNQLNLLKAMEAFPDKKLVIIGHVRNQHYYDEIKALTNSEQLYYAGPMDHHSPLLRSAYQACELFCLPSTLETPGLAALEAMAQGCDLLVTKEGSTIEYFGESISCIDPLSTTAIQNSLNEFYLTRLDLTLKKDNREFLWSFVIDDLVNVYKGLVNK